MLRNSDHICTCITNVAGCSWPLDSLYTRISDNGGMGGSVVTITISF